MSTSRALKRELTRLVAAECERLRKGFTTHDVVAALPTLAPKRVAKCVSMLLLLGWIIPIAERRLGNRHFVFAWHGREGAVPRRSGTDSEPQQGPTRLEMDRNFRARIGDRARFDAALSATEVAQLRRILNDGAQAQR